MKDKAEQSLGLNVMSDGGLVEAFRSLRSAAQPSEGVSAKMRDIRGSGATARQDPLAAS